MTEETLARQIKVFCPQHQSVFETADAPTIVCEIREHTLSNDFPNAEFWEYCADCQTFSPSELEIGGKAKIACPQCERPTVSRFVCGNCKIVSCDSGEDTKGKIYTVDTDSKTVEPSCAGCLTVFSGVKLELHKCEESEAVFLTSRQICPFCKKEILKAKPKRAIEAPPVIKCPKCRTNNEADSFFCNNCGEEFRSNPQITKRRTSTAKTRLLGSICPTCGSGSPPASDFCGNCGQALKAEKAKPKQKIRLPQQVLNQSPIGNVGTTQSVKPKGAGQGLTAVGIILALIAACCVCANLKSKKDDSDSLYPAANRNFSSPTYSNSISNPNKTNSYNSNALNTNNSFKPIQKRANSANSNKLNMDNSNISNSSNSNMSNASNLNTITNSKRFGNNNSIGSNINIANSRPRTHPNYD